MASSIQQRRRSLFVLSLLMMSWIAFQLIFQSETLPTYDKVPLATAHWCSHNASDPRCKKILLWNKADRIEASAFGLGHEAFVSQKCPVVDCLLTANRSEFPFEQYDVVVINAHEMWATRLPDARQRQSHQRFVFFTQESPAAIVAKPPNFDAYFNWTMSYRLDSDVRLLYGRINPVTEVSHWTPDQIRLKMTEYGDNGINHAANKTRSVAWMASHCPTFSQREDYVWQLQQHIDVDVYGVCGNLSCPRDNSHWISDPECYDMIERRYKFYLSFENAICTDYVTEKLYHILERNIVPIVFGGADYHLLAPPYSYIDAMKYTPDELARYLHQLAADDALYNAFFWWKPYYRIEAGVHQMSRHAFCDLCAKLHSDQTAVGVNRSLSDDWSVQRQCRTHKVATSHQRKWPDLIRFTLGNVRG